MTPFSENQPSLFARSALTSRAVTKHHPERGATLVEAAITLPIFLTLIVVVFDVSLFYLAKSSIQQSATRALVLAQVIPGLEDDSLNDRSKPRNLTAIAEVMKTSKESLNSQRVQLLSVELKPIRLITVIKTELDLPDPKPSLKAALISQPMAISTTANYSSGLPFLSGTEIQITVRGYRDPPFISFLPPLIDPAGVPVTKFKVEEER